MKKVFLNCMLLLCALIVGSGDLWATNYVLVEDNADIVDGGEYLIVAKESSSYYALSTTQNTNNRGRVAVTVSSKTISTVPATAEVITLEATGTKYFIKTSTGNYLFAVSEQNYLKTGTDKTDAYKFTVTKDKITSSVKAKNGSSNTDYSDLQHNNSGSIFSCYKHTQTDVTLYKKQSDIPAAPTFSASAGEFNASFDLTISSAEGTTLKYTTDGTDPSTSGSAISVATNSVIITIPAATTRVRAIAIKSGVNSAETNVLYTYSSKEEPTFSLSPSPMSLKVGDSGTLTLTTNSDGDITFSCDDAHVTLSGTGNSRTVSADAEGNYTVNVSVAATSTYMSKAGSVTVSVTKHSTSIAIDASSINSELKNGHDGGTLSASVTYGDPAAAVPESSVTWTSSNSSVATVGYSTGVVTLLKSGNTTITATYAATTTFAGSTKTYALSVTDSRNKFEWDLSTNSYDASPSESLISWSNSRAQMKNERTGEETAVNNYIPTTRTSTRFYASNKLTVTPVAGYRINTIEFFATSDGYASALASSSWTNATATSNGQYVYVTPTKGLNAVSASIGATCGFTKVTVCYDVVVTIGSTGWATFSCSDPLDLSNLPDDLTAYEIRNADITGATITPNEVSSAVPAGTGLLLSGSATSYEIPVAVSGSSLGSNLLVGVTSQTNITAEDIASHNYYVLANQNDVLGFYKLVSATTIPANKAYLYSSDQSFAPSIIRIVDEAQNATNIENIEANEKAVKFIENGRILILRDGITYDALGRKIR